MKVKTREGVISYDDHTKLEIDLVDRGIEILSGPTEAFRFELAAGAHSCVDAGTTKTSPGTVSAWIEININGTAHFIPAYTSKTS